MSTGTTQRTWDYFVSYTSSDEVWAERIATILKEVGATAFQKWHILAGDNFVAKVHEFIEDSRVLVLVMSAKALSSEWVMREVTSAIAAKKQLLPVRIERCRRPGILATFVTVDVFGVTHSEVRTRLLNAAQACSKTSTATAADPRSLAPVNDWAKPARNEARLIVRTATLRRTMNTIFDDGSFTAMCLDNFPEVYERFSTGMTVEQKQTLLLDHCRRRGLLERLARLLDESMTRT